MRRVGWVIAALVVMAACDAAEDGERCGDQPACVEGWLCDRGECRKPCIAADQCEGFEACEEGLCRAVPDPACTWDGECAEPSGCETVVGVQCRAGRCHYPYAPDGFPCDRDGGERNGHCTSGLCLPTDTSCQSNGQCQPGTCIAASCGVPSGVGGTCDTGPDDDFDCVEDLRCISGVCLVADGGDCDGNGDCMQTCVESTCRAVSAEAGPCDANDDADCDFGLTCQVDATCGPGVPCVDNGGCGSPSESCIEEICRERAGTGAACDAGPDDSDDCQSGHVCIDGVCLLLDGQACAGNHQCEHVCIDSLCVGRSATLGECDGSENADCLALHSCLGSICLLDNGGICDDNGECVNACIASMCRDLSSLAGPCDLGDTGDCGAGLECVGGACLLGDGGACAGNHQCVHTCIGPVCAPLSGDTASCDPGDDDDCAAGLRCQTDNTCALGTPCPGGNIDCISATESCIEQVCRVLAPTGAACDAPSDHDDCQTGNWCIAGECLRIDGESCDLNSQCINVCVDLGPRACAAASATNGPCDAADGNGDCEVDRQCLGGQCLLDDQQICNDNDQCVNVCVESECGAQSAASGPCDEDADCLQGTCEVNVCLAPSVLRIFATDAIYSGAFASLSTADAHCRDDADNPLGAGNGTWAAMLGIAGVREVGSNWIMLGSTQYYTADGTTVVDTTDANGWFGNGVLAPIRSPARTVWTGLETSGAAAPDNCAAWASTAANGVTGRSASTGRQWVDTGTDLCTVAHHLYCVEQP